MASPYVRYLKFFISGMEKTFLFIHQYIKLSFSNGYSLADRLALRGKRLEHRKAIAMLSEIKDAKKQGKLMRPVVDKLLEVSYVSTVSVSYTVLM